MNNQCQTECPTCRAPANQPCRIPRTGKVKARMHERRINKLARLLATLRKSGVLKAEEKK